MIEAALIIGLIVFARRLRSAARVAVPPITVHIHLHYPPPGPGELQPIEEPLREKAGNVVTLRPRRAA